MYVSPNQADTEAIALLIAGCEVALTECSHTDQTPEPQKSSKSEASACFGA